MANNNRPKVVRGKDEKSIVINNLVIRSVDRGRKDIKDFRNAHKIADYVENPSRVRLYDLYDDILLDAHLTGIIGKRLRALRNKRLRYIDAKGQPVDGMDEFLRSKQLRYIRGRIFWSQAWELAGMEFVRGEEVTALDVPVKHIKPHLGVVTKEQHSDEPCEEGDYNANPMLWVIQNKEDKFGFLLKAVPWVLYKRGNVGDWAQYIELFGQPSRVYSYEPGDTEGKKVLEDAMNNAGAALSMMIPTSVKYQTDDAKQTNANGELQEKFKNTCDEQLSILVLGQTETTKSSSSSGYAQASVHQEQQFDITADDMEYELQWLNDKKFLAILKSYGLPVVEGGRFEHEVKANPTALLEELEIDKELRALGVPLSLDHFYETYNRDKPEEGEAVAQEEEVEPEPTNEPSPKKKPGNGKKKGESSEDDDEDDLMWQQPSGWWNKAMSYLADFFDPAR